MKNITRLLGVAAVVAGLFAMPSPAHAERACGQGFVTPEEYAQFEPGVTTFGDVKSITGRGGKPMDDPAIIFGNRMDRTWKVCPNSQVGWVLMSFQWQPGDTGPARRTMVLQWKDARWS